MAVNSVASATGGLQQQLTTARQSQEGERPRENNGSGRTEGAQPAPGPQTSSGQRQERPERAERPEPPRPVVNTQGQKTGSIINTTA